MPELPEVETIRRQLGPELVGRKVVEAGSHPSEKFTPARALVGAEITSHGRRGKFLLFPTDDDRELVVHLGMTGRLGFASPADAEDEPESPYLRAWWMLDDGRRLDFVDVRRFGRIRVVPSGDYGTIPTLAAAGPEPFDESLDGRILWQNLKRSRRRVKTQLLSQRPIAGIGNIYADEALWLAGISPKATAVSQARAARLLDAIRDVLTTGIDNGGTTLRDYRDAEGRTGENQFALKAYGRAGLPCHRCQKPLVSDVVDGRNTTWCDKCQPR
jgi:formamidopyrimidine-DNA glycosylase